MPCIKALDAPKDSRANMDDDIDEFDKILSSGILVIYVGCSHWIKTRPSWSSFFVAMLAIFPSTGGV
jgi:hypothetical protein